MAHAWQEINKNETARIDAALALLKATANGYAHLTYAIVNPKLQPGSQPVTTLHCLRLYSYGDPLAPLVSAFFFLRRRKKQGGPDAPGQWAYCLTVGAKDTTNGGLTAAELRDALNDVCLTVKALAPAVKREVMHLPPKPAFLCQNLEDVFDEMHRNAQPPKKKPRFEVNGTITLGSPWVPKDSSGNEVLLNFVWLDIVEK
jgi:hypothetical protein